jgi:hypothetical protein
MTAAPNATILAPGFFLCQAPSRPTAQRTSGGAGSDHASTSHALTRISPRLAGLPAGTEKLRLFSPQALLALSVRHSWALIVRVRFSQVHLVPHIPSYGRQACCHRRHFRCRWALIPVP